MNYLPATGISLLCMKNSRQGRAKRSLQKLCLPFLPSLASTQIPCVCTHCQFVNRRNEQNLRRCSWEGSILKINSSYIGRHCAMLTFRLSVFTFQRRASNFEAQTEIRSGHSFVTRDSFSFFPPAFAGGSHCPRLRERTPHPRTAPPGDSFPHKRGAVAFLDNEKLSWQVSPLNKRLELIFKSL